MPIRLEADNRDFIHFILFCSGMLYLPKLCGRAGRVGGNQTCTKLTLNKENTKSFMLSAVLKAFAGTKPNQLPRKAKGFPPLLPTAKVLYTLFLLIFPFFLPFFFFFNFLSKPPQGIKPASKCQETCLPFVL
jgi:hypothetical protein